MNTILVLLASVSTVGALEKKRIINVSYLPEVGQGFNFMTGGKGGGEERES